MPMQIGLDELLSMLLARVDGLAMDAENQKSRFNIMFRILYKKGLFSEADTLETVQEVGYKVNVQGNTVVLNIGFSHPVNFVLPAGIQAKMENNKIIQDYYYFKIKSKRTGYIKALNNYSHGYTFALLK